MAGKWLELLKEISPRVTRAGVLRNPTITSGVGQFGAIQSVAPSLGVELRPIDVRDVNAIESGVAALAGISNGGLIVTCWRTAEPSSRADHYTCGPAQIARGLP